MTVLEGVAATLGLFCVWFSVKENIWTWPTGIGMVSLYLIIFYEVRLYSDMILQAIYIVLQVYGWFQWLHGGREHGRLAVSRIPGLNLAVWFAAGIVATALLGYAMNTYTNADLPYWDASATVLSLIGQYLMAKKVVESWVFWIIVNILSIGIYVAKDLHITAGLYLVFLLVAIRGLIEWKRTAGELVPDIGAVPSQP